jgi:hypothetical protein
MVALSQNERDWPGDVEALEESLCSSLRKPAMDNRPLIPV